MPEIAFRRRRMFFIADEDVRIRSFIRSEINYRATASASCAGLLGSFGFFWVLDSLSKIIVSRIREIFSSIKFPGEGTIMFHGIISNIR